MEIAGGSRVGRLKKQQFVESMLTVQEDLTEQQKQVLAAHDDALSLTH